MTQTAPSTATIVDTYLASLTEPDEHRRAQLLREAWVADGRYSDPHHELVGYDAFSETIAGIVTQFPGFRFQRVTAVDAHHRSLRFGWQFVSPTGDAVLEGLDVGTLAGDGRLATITGFHGQLQPA